MSTQSPNDRQVGGQHYAGGYQHWDFVVKNKIPYLEAQITRYVTRWQKKSGAQDVEKAIHYLEKLVSVWQTDLQADVESGDMYRDGAINIDPLDLVQFFTQEGSTLGTLELGIFSTVLLATHVEQLSTAKELLHRLHARAKMNIDVQEPL